jgi:NDP-sugar pyrophosphorylase family protein
VNAVVLVGGEGTRLRPLTSTAPKPLLPIAGVPMIERQLAWLESNGVDDVVLSLGYLPDAFVARFPGGRFGSLGLDYAVEPEPLGTAGAIRFAAELGGIHDRFVVCNGDVLTTLDLAALVAFHDERRAAATIHLTEVDDPSALGAVPTYDDGEVEAFVEKPPPGEAPTNWINAGTYVLDPTVLAQIPSGVAVSVERETFPRLLQTRGRVYACPTDDYWLDVGTPQTYVQAHLDVLHGSLGRPPAPGAREVLSGVWTQGSVDALEHAVVTAPVLVGDGVAIGVGAQLVGATVGPGCRVGREAVVENSVLLPGAQLADGACARESIVGWDAHLEAGASVVDYTIVGASARVAAGASLTGGRVSVPATAG